MSPNQSIRLLGILAFLRGFLAIGGEAGGAFETLNESTALVIAWNRCRRKTRTNALASSRSIRYCPGMVHRRLSDEIRDAVNASGMSRYAIAKALGIAESTMSRFMSGKGGLSMEYIDLLADLLGLHIAVKTAKKQGGK